eukprot:gene10703-12448_t
MSFFVAIIVAIAMASAVYGHGYTAYPPARHMVCVNNYQNSIWWPEDGSGILEPSCRAAFQYVRNKYNGNSDAARTQYVQSNEYSVMIPNYSQGYSALTAAVPDTICGAHAINANAQFGDKSGFSIAANWKPTSIKVNSTSVNSKVIEYQWCATAAHSPNFWEFYVSKVGYNYANAPLTWADLQLIQVSTNLQPVQQQVPNCSSGQIYKLNLTLPARFNPTTLVTRWQRDDPAGECFINCSDYINTV